MGDRALPADEYGDDYGAVGDRALAADEYGDDYG